MKLDPYQQQASDHFEGPMLVLAGPGSGKTTVITERLKMLTEKHGVPPENILALSFSRAAAGEIRRRFKQESAVSDAEPLFGTFHSIFYNILRSGQGFSGLRVISENEKYGFLKTRIEELSPEASAQDNVLPELVRIISSIKGSTSPVSVRPPCGLTAADLKRICSSYEEYKLRNSLLDFDDMILKCHRMFSRDRVQLDRWREQFTFLLIDEFQDINTLQYETVKLLAGERANIFVVGDDDQSIYGFRGADPSVMRRFLSDFEDAELVRLRFNYRSSEKIITAAGRLIRKNKDRLDKEIVAAKDAASAAGCGVFITRYENRQAECAALAAGLAELKEPQRAAVLFRGNNDSLLLQHELSISGVPFRVNGKKKSIFEHFIFRDIFAYLKLANEKEMSRADLLRILNKPVRYISPEALRQPGGDLFLKLRRRYAGNLSILTAVRRLENDIGFLKGLPAGAAFMYILKVIGYEKWLSDFRAQGRGGEDTEDMLENIHAVLREAETYEGLILLMNREAVSGPAEAGAPAVSIMTMHASKGLEFDIVFLPDVNEGIVPNMNNSVGGVQEERRLFYVAMTRAKKVLNISFTGQLHGKTAGPSRFIGEMGGDIISDSACGVKIELK